jgi:putative NADH-flavin reductase
MKLVVFGATGGIGAQVVEQALDVGHEVTAVARRPEAITRRHPCLQVVKGDVLDPESVRNAVIGREIVVAAIGARDRAPTTVYSQGNVNIMAAMRDAHIRRLFCISASGLDPGPLWQRIFAKPMLWFFLKESYTDLVRMETAVSASGLDWTILRPPRLTDGAHTGRYESVINGRLKRDFQVSRADVADYILKHLTDRATYQGFVNLAY